MPANAFTRTITGIVSVIGLASAVLVATHPEGLTQGWLSWLGALQMFSFAALTLLPSIFRGDVNAKEVEAALGETTQPKP